MTQSHNGGEEDALDRLIRRRVFEPVTPESEEEVAATPSDAPDPPVGQVDPGVDAPPPPDRPMEPEPAPSPVSEIEPVGARPQGGYAEPPRVVRRARPVTPGPPEGAFTDWDQVRRSPYFRFLLLAVAVVIVFFVARALAGALGGGVNSLFDRLVSLDAPFPPVPGPDDPVVVA
ncbi:MAG: hypothetical protein OXG11_00820, partial [Chloroflexi bacterium]|nr:hypothetical protein [Chloroflexota bacterium]